MDGNRTMALAKKELACRIEAKEHFLEYTYRWEYQAYTFLSFQINQPGHSHYRSTLSVRIDGADAELENKGIPSMFNKVILVGKLGADPHVIENEEITATFPLATQSYIKNPCGKTQMTTDWHRIVVYGALFDHCKKYLKENETIIIEGELKTSPLSQGKNKKGLEHFIFTTEVAATSITTLSNN